MTTYQLPDALALLGADRSAQEPEGLSKMAVSFRQIPRDFSKFERN